MAWKASCRDGYRQRKRMNPEALQRSGLGDGEEPAGRQEQQ